MTGAEPILCVNRGVTLQGFVRRPASAAPHPVVVIIHGGLGIDHIVPRTAERLAEIGYLAVAADMLGREAQTGGGAAIAEAFAAFGHDPTLAGERTAAWIETARALPEASSDRIAAIGYCFGGHCVLEVARRGVDVQAVVSFHGILTTSAPASPGAVKTEVAVYSGGRDPFVPHEHVQALHHELTTAGAAFQITTFSEAEHAFTDPNAGALGRQGLSHNAVADQVSWAGMTALLELKLRG